MPKSTKHSDNVTANVRSQILSCRLRPGSRLRMSELCDRYQVSLGAVREALSRLTAEGLVVAEAQKGFTVAPVSIEELDELTETRIDIESLCISRSVRNGGLDWESAIVAAHHQLRNTPEREEIGGTLLQAEDWAEAHGKFHKSLVAACGNNILLEIRAALYARSQRYRALAIPLDRSGRDIASEHDQIVQAVLTKDAKGAKHLIARHFRSTAKIIRESTELFGEKELEINRRTG